jgi:Ca2+-binding RTX toxin-like protein
MTSGKIDNAVLIAKVSGYGTWDNVRDFSYHFLTSLPGFYNGVSAEEEKWKGAIVSYDQLPFLTLSPDKRRLLENRLIENGRTGILKSLSDFADVNFTRSSDIDSSQLIFGQMGFTPDQREVRLEDQTISLRTTSGWSGNADGSGTIRPGAVWITNYAETDGRDQGDPVHVGNTRLRAVLAHETAHSLGLAHTFDTALKNIAQENTTKFSIMAYNPHPVEGVRAEEYQLYDIASLQYLYGRKEDATDNRYTDFTDAQGYNRMFSIWDGGGLDHIDASANPVSAYIDLRPGYFSSIGPGKGLKPENRVQFEDNTELPQLKPKQTGPENISIAFGAYIEDATGTAQSDVIIGNQFTNVLRGGSGADIIFGDGLAVAEVNAALRALGLKDTGVDGDPLDGTVDADYRRIRQGGYDPASAQFNPRDEQLDTIFGGDGNDIIGGTSGEDYLHGNIGKDILIGGDGDDLLFGGAGDDILIGGGGGGADLIDGGDSQTSPDEDGDDKVDYSAITGPTRASGVGIGIAVGFAEPLRGAMTVEVIDGPANEKDTLRSIETIIGTKERDVVTVKSFTALMDKTPLFDLGANSADKGDVISFEELTDAPDGKKGVEINLLSRQAQTASLPGGAGSLTLKNVEDVIGSRLDDKIIGSSTKNILLGGKGDDILEGYGGNDILRGGADDDFDEDTLDGGKGNDTLYASRSDIIRNVDKGDKIYFKNIFLDDGFSSQVGAGADGEGTPASNVEYTTSASVTYLYDGSSRTLTVFTNRTGGWLEIKNSTWAPRAVGRVRARHGEWRVIYRNGPRHSNVTILQRAAGMQERSSVGVKRCDICVRKVA